MKKKLQKFISMLLVITLMQIYIPTNHDVHTHAAETYSCGNYPLNSGLVYDCDYSPNAGAVPGHYEGGTVCAPTSGSICNICGNAYSGCPHTSGTTYGGTVCAPYSGSICNICGNPYSGCPHSSGTTYGGTVCSPSAGTICNICNDPYSGCPHASGQWYNGKQCVPYTGKICNICNDNYSGCPHSSGTTYGGTVCTPYAGKICNVCGSSFSKCSHTTGTTYGGTVCSPTTGSVCNICHGNFANCSHISGQTYGATWVPATANYYHVHTSTCASHYTTHTHTSACPVTSSTTEWNITVPVGKAPVSVLSNKNVVFNNSGITWKYIGRDVMELCKTAQAILTAARSQQDIDNFNNSEIGRLFNDVIPHNRALSLTKEQLSFIFLIDPDGVRDYLYINYNRDLVNNVYRILTDKEPVYYEHTLFNGWVETDRRDSSLWSAVKTDGDVLLVRGDGMPDDLIDIVLPTIVVGLTFYGLSEIALLADGIAMFGFRNAITAYTYGMLRTQVEYMKMPGLTVNHAVTSSGAATSVIKGIDPRYFNSASRFGGGFYVTETEGTAIAELAAHDAQAASIVKFNMDITKAVVLDLKNPTVAAQWGFTSNATYAQCQSIAARAQAAGYNVISWASFRTGGTNYVIYNNFTNILKPFEIVPIQ